MIAPKDGGGLMSVFRYKAASDRGDYTKALASLHQVYAYQPSSSGRCARFCLARQTLRAGLMSPEVNISTRC